MTRTTMLAGVAVAGILVPGAAFAATINVPADHATIQAAITAAAAGDEVVVAPGTYNEAVLLNKAITLRSANPTNAATVAATIIDSLGADHTVNISAAALLDGFVITGGNADGAFPNNEGGGIFLSSSPTIRNCTITGNVADFGGGMMSRGAPVIEHCTFVGNSAEQGGGIDSGNAGPTVIRGSSFIGNFTDSMGFESGGGIQARHAMTLTGCSFISNSAANAGGGLRVQNAATVTVDGCTFVANSGAGLNHASSSTVTVRNSMFCNNTATNLSGSAIVSVGGNSLSGCTGLDLENNDDCADALDIGTGDTAYSNLGALDDGPALPGSCDEGPGLGFGRDVWFRHVPSANGTLTVSTCGQVDYDSRLAAYTGQCGSLALVACNDDAAGCGVSSEMDVPVTCGQAVLIRVGGYDGEEGGGTLTLTLASCPADFDGNGVVGFADLNAVLGAWGNCP